MTSILDRDFENLDSKMFNILNMLDSSHMKITGETLDVILGALAEQLRSLADQREIVVIGGSALTALGLVETGHQGR